MLSSPPPVEKLIFMGSQYMLMGREREIKKAQSQSSEKPQPELAIRQRSYHKRPSREQLIARLSRIMAHVFWRTHGVPFSEEEVEQALANPSEQLAKQISWFNEIRGSMAALLDMSEELVWTELDVSDRSTWPQDKQKVYYFFEVVGTHAGEFAGPLSEEEILAQRQENPQICDVFEDDLTRGASFHSRSGFLDMYDVSHWVARPVKQL